VKYVAQLVAYAAFMLLLGVLSIRPELRLMADDEAIVSLSFSHAANRVGECRRLSQQELLALPPNMRQPDDCPRERHPLRIELEMDGQMLYKATLPPSGLWDDGKSTAYQRIRVGAGTHEFRIRMSDSGKAGSFDFENTSTVTLLPAQNMLVYFDATQQRLGIHLVAP